MPGTVVCRAGQHGRGSRTWLSGSLHEWQVALTLTLVAATSVTTATRPSPTAQALQPVCPAPTARGAGWSRQVGVHRNWPMTSVGKVCSAGEWCQSGVGRRAGPGSRSSDSVGLGLKAEPQSVCCTSHVLVPQAAFHLLLRD